jgi:hypothetical protein
MVGRDESGNSSFADKRANGRSLGRASAPKDRSERIGLLIARWGARRTGHLGPVLLQRLRFEIGRRGRAGGVVVMTFSSSVHNSKIMLGVLVKVFRGDSIATRRRLARKGNVTFEDLMRATSDFDVRTVTIEDLTSVRYLLSITVGIIISTTRSAGLSWSHDTGCIDGEVGTLSNESVSEPSLAEAEGLASLFCTSAKLFRAETLDDAVFISNRFLV